MRTKQEPFIETSPVRLSVDETRIIMRLATAGKPVTGDYHYGALADIGILERIEVSEEKETASQIDECWKRAKVGMAVKSEEQVHQAMHDIERLTRDRDRNEARYKFALSDLGKQIARGITIRLNGKR